MLTFAVTSVVPTYAEYHVDRDVADYGETLVSIWHVSAADNGSTIAGKLKGFPSDALVSKGIVDLVFEPSDDVLCWSLERHIEMR